MTLVAKGVILLYSIFQTVNFCIRLYYPSRICQCL